MAPMLRAILATLLLCAFALACSKDEPKSTRWDDAADAAAQKAAAKASAVAAGSAPVVVDGAALNAAFPADPTDDMKRVFTQEKAGFAEAKLQKDGKDVATLSVSDVNANQDAKSKFAEAKEKLGEHPMVTVGKNQTSILVKDRWQVKVSSQTLDHDARKKLIEKFDLKRLP